MALAAREGVHSVLEAGKLVVRVSEVLATGRNLYTADKLMDICRQAGGVPVRRLNSEIDVKGVQVNKCVRRKLELDLVRGTVDLLVIHRNDPHWGGLILFEFLSVV